GATSAIAQACARIWAQQGCEFVLCARNEERLKLVVSDLQARGATSVQMTVSDAKYTDRLKDTVAFAMSTLGHIDYVLIAHGELPDQLHMLYTGQAIRESFELNP